MSTRRLVGTVIGPVRPGILKVMVGQNDEAFAVDADVGRIPDGLRLPNSNFVAVLNGRELVGVEALETGVLDLEDQIRRILNTDWDPIGVAKFVHDEYDGYIGEIHSLLRSGASVGVVAQHLLGIENNRMGYNHDSADHLHAVAAKLCALPTRA